MKRFQYNIFAGGLNMNKIRVAINGFGRIGRMVFRQAIFETSIEIVAINASYPPETLAHLIKYDSIHGSFTGKVEVVDKRLYVNRKEILLVQSRDPEMLPWKEHQIDIVIEATGKFNDMAGACLHLKAGAKKVILSAPGNNVDKTIVMGVNETEYNPERDDVISNASCTTNCLAPVVKVLHDNFGIKNGMMTTVHSFTTDQKNLDNPHKDLRRARGCTQSIIPTSTGAAKALGKVLPELDGKLHGMALRVPTPNVSLIDLVVDLKTRVTAEDVNEVFRSATQTSFKDIIQYSDEPLVSIDYTTTDYSAIVDGLSTNVLDHEKVKVLAWYDNEWGYSRRVVDLLIYVNHFIHQEAHI